MKLAAWIVLALLVPAFVVAMASIINGTPPTKAYGFAAYFLILGLEVALWAIVTVSA